MVTKEWAAIHRKHHAKCETAEDPHSPQMYGINRVLWGGVFLYVEGVEEPGDDGALRPRHAGRLDRAQRLHALTRSSASCSCWLIDIAAVRLVPGVLIWLTQIVWIPFWAAGVINGVGHCLGYRNYDVRRRQHATSFPWGILIGGEELHNNHHAFATSAKLSSKWYEFDIGWMYIRMLEALGLATVKKVAPKPRFARAKRGGRSARRCRR